MCGIVGFINLKNSAKHLTYENLLEVQKAMEVQKHRGPDDAGVCAFNFSQRISYAAETALKLNADISMDGIVGFNRLSIKDLSSAGHQPMTTIDGKVILVFNGEIYNDAELRKELIQKGYLFKSKTDTEVILNMYLEYGFKLMLSRLNGMFAIAIVDLRAGMIFLARDRFGIKPLYYSFQRGQLLFASELKSIIQFQDFKRKLDMDAVNARLIFARPGDKVLFKGAAMLAPGWAAEISYGGESSFFQYFNINVYQRKESKDCSAEEALEAAEEIFKDAVSRQMVSDVKLGCQLSGGIDSTLVSYYAHKEDGSNLNDGVSIVDSMGELGEERYIDYVGNQIGLDVHKFKLEQDYFLQNYERMIWHSDTPVYRPYFVCFLKLTERAKDYVTVLLSGEGADELTGGYGRFAAGVYQPFISKIGNNSKSVKVYRNYAEYAVQSDSTITEFIANGGAGAEDLIEEQICLFKDFAGTNFDKQIKYEMTQRLPESLMRQDKMSMANSIENRVPFLDNKVVDFVMELPESMLIRFAGNSPMDFTENPFEWVTGKYVWKELCAREFGYDFAYRKKTIMVLDERNMVTSNGFREMFFEKIFPKMQGRGIVNDKQVLAWYKNVEHLDYRDFTCMWRAISLETWCQLFLDTQGSGV